MKVKLTIDGKQKLFTNTKITFWHIQHGTKLLMDLENEKFMSNTSDLMADLETAVEFIVAAFGNQFTVDEFNLGYEGDGAVAFRKLLEDVLQEIQYGSVYRQAMDEVEKKKMTTKQKNKKTSKK